MNGPRSEGESIRDMKPAARVARVFAELERAELESGLGPEDFKITEWEMNFLKSNSDSTWETFTDRQDAVMRKIEAKVFEAS